MYSDKLEALIDAILADGVITEKEMALLRRKAAEEGEDPDEVEIVIEGRLAKQQRAQQTANPATMAPPPPPAMSPVAPPPVPRPKSSKYGSVQRCPQCNEVVEAGMMKCTCCGYIFRGIDAVSSVRRFSQMINAIEANSGDSGIIGSIGALYGLDSHSRRVVTAIQTFPIPNTKEDLLEFLLYLQPKCSSSSMSSNTISARRIVDAYKVKYKECVKKAQVFFPDDPQFRLVLEKEKGFFKKLFS